MIIFSKHFRRSDLSRSTQVSLVHPDPEARQFRVLQKILQNLISGACRVSLPAGEESFWGRMTCPTAADFRNQALYIWYDFFSVPQGTDSQAVGNRKLAVASIPSYCANAYFFLILSPSVPHAEKKDLILSYASWSDRGWCRLERMARALARDDGFVIRVEDTDTPTLFGREVLSLYKAPGRGSFAIETDKFAIAPVLLRMIQQKLQSYLDNKDFHKYRFLLSMQRHYLDGLEVDEVEGLIPGFESKDASDTMASTAAKFLHETAFAKVSQYDTAGWSPLCYAAVRGNPEVVKALLYSKAHCQEAMKKGKVDAFLAPKTPVLTLAAAYGSNEVLKVLLSQRAHINARDGHQSTALVMATWSDNVEGAHLLCDAKIDPNLRNWPGMHPFTNAACTNGLLIMKELRRRFELDLSCQSDWSLTYIWFPAMLGYADGETTSYLIEASANINLQLSVPMSETNWWLFFKAQGKRHLVSPSALTRLCYHYKGATPLMFAILAGRFEAASVLLQAGARLDLKNARGKTAVDLVREVQANMPETFNALLAQRASVTSLTWKDWKNEDECEEIPMEKHQSPLASHASQVMTR